MFKQIALVCLTSASFFSAPALMAQTFQLNGGGTVTVNGNSGSFNGNQTVTIDGTGTPFQITGVTAGGNNAQVRGGGTPFQVTSVQFDSTLVNLSDFGSSLTLTVENSVNNTVRIFGDITTNLFSGFNVSFNANGVGSVPGIVTITDATATITPILNSESLDNNLLTTATLDAPSATVVGTTGGRASAVLSGTSGSFFGIPAIPPTGASASVEYLFSMQAGTVLTGMPSRVFPFGGSERIDDSTFLSLEVPRDSTNGKPFNLFVGDINLGRFNPDQSVKFSDYRSRLGNLLLPNGGVKSFRIVVDDDLRSTRAGRPFLVKLDFSRPTSTLELRTARVN